MSLPALLNVGLIAARMGAREIEFGVKKVHSLQVQKKGPTDYVTEMDRKIETLVFEEIKKYYPEHNFLGISSGDRWCLCAERWKQAYFSNKAPKVILEATNILTLSVIELNLLKKFSN